MSQSNYCINESLTENVKSRHTYYGFSDIEQIEPFETITFRHRDMPIVKNTHEWQVIPIHSARFNIYPNIAEHHHSGTLEYHHKLIQIAGIKPKKHDLFPAIEKISQDLTINIEDNTFILPIELSHIAEEIEDSKKILTLLNDWDEEGAIAPPISILMQSIHLLVSYSKWIFDNLDIIIASPTISAVPDGSIDMEWRTNKARLLINIKNNGNHEAYYYGDFYKNLNSIKGQICTRDFQTYFAHWMSNLTNEI